MIQKNIYKFSLENFDSAVVSLLLEKMKYLLASTSRNINIALSGGNTPIPILELLSKEQVSWDRICFFMVDERCVTLESKDSNYKNIQTSFFSKIPASSFSMVLEGKSFEESIYIYSEELQKLPQSANYFPIFDLILLGMGDDGHTASLFPLTNALKEEKKWVTLNEVPQLNTQRITLTYPVLLNSKEIFVLIKGTR